MARPMILIEEALLKELYTKHKDGVKYNTLIKHYDLDITGPTIKKLLYFYDFMVTSEPVLSSMIRKSLFPKWLVNEVQQQKPGEWAYAGTMPIGSWKEQ